MSSRIIIAILLVCLIAWSMYRRVRRNIGRQNLHPRRAITSIVILSLVSALIVATSFQNTNLLLGFCGGLLLGTMLGFFGLRLTRFETTDAGHFYTPNTHIGVALSSLLIGRMVYRFWILRDISTAANHPPPMQSPLTSFIIALTVGYYIVYQTGLFIHSRDKNIASKKSLQPGNSN
jgi:membrane-associated HD superfamily phosphohydrolase